MRGVKPRCAATALESLNLAESSIVALNAKLTTGPTPGIVINRLHTSSFRAICPSRRSSKAFCFLIMFRASSKGSIANRSSGASASNVSTLAANVHRCTAPSLRPCTFNSPRIGCLDRRHVIGKLPTRDQRGSQQLRSLAFDVHRPEVAEPHHLGDATRVAAVGLVRA
jgi:hypothetical protein